MLPDEDSILPHTIDITLLSHSASFTRIRIDRSSCSIAADLPLLLFVDDFGDIVALGSLLLLLFSF